MSAPEQPQTPEPRVQIIDGEPQPISELIPPTVQRLVAQALDAPTGTVHIESVTPVGNGIVISLAWFVPHVASAP